MTGWPVGFFFSRSGVFDGGDALGDRARLEHPLQGFLPARNVCSLNPWHFDSRFPAANLGLSALFTLKTSKDFQVEHIIINIKMMC